MRRREFLKNGAVALTAAATKPLFAWQGANTVDVLVTATNAPLAPRREGRGLGTLTATDLEQMRWIADDAGPRAESDAGA